MGWMRCTTPLNGGNVAMPNPRSGPETEATHFEASVRAVAHGADELASRCHGYRLLMGPDRLDPPTRRFATWAEVVAAVEHLRRTTPAFALHTARYVDGVLHALGTFASVRDGRQLSYVDQVAAYLQIEEIEVAAADLDALRDRVLRHLVALGYPDDLAAGLRAWERDRAVPTAEIAAMVRPLVEAAKQRSIALGIPVPRTMTVETIVNSSPYYAYASYHGGFRGTVELSSDLLWTRESLKHSVCHEAFPGHQASAAAKEVTVQAGAWGPVVLPSLANTPASPVVEGIAENGVDFLGWRSSPHDELFAAWNRLTFGVCTNAALRRHQDGESRDRVIDAMQRQAGVSNAWATYQYRFITDPLWHTSFPHYWHGRRLVRRVWERYQSREQERIALLYATPQTTATLRLLIEGEDA